MKTLLLLFFTYIVLFASDEMGALLFHGNCVTCHFELEEKSAPAMIEVRRRYKEAFPMKKDFVNQPHWKKYANILTYSHRGVM